jgi:hypothetical protein
MKKFIPALLAILIVGCGQNGTEPQEPLAAPLSEKTPQWTLLSQGTFHPFENPTTTLLITREKTAWNFLHRRITGMAPEKEIDFSTDLGISMLSRIKPTGGYSLEVTDISWSGNTATLYIKEASPAPGQMVPKIITSPYTLATITAPSGWVLVEVENGTVAIGLERTYAYLVDEHFGSLYKPLSTLAQAASIPELSGGICPIDNSLLAEADLYTGNPGGPCSAHYCPEDGKYWVHQGTQGQWYGPFSPGY